MIDIATWMDVFVEKLNDIFGKRVWFVGLQGSYSRGEATESSDIDMVVILDKLTAADIGSYRTMLDTLPHREKICGFLSGKNEIIHWDAADLFQFYHDTTTIKGSLDELLATIDESAVDRAIKLGACNIYHGCVHNMLHQRSEKTLQGLYKSASFVVQAIAFQQTGTYFRYMEELYQAVASDEHAIIATFLHLKKGGAVDFDSMSETLFHWAKKWIGESMDNAEEK